MNEVEDQQCTCCSTKTDVVSSLQLDRKVKCRTYSSQFTLDDELQVSVDRREQYSLTENVVIIEVDISVGYCGRRKENMSVGDLRLGEMATEDRWVSKITNYDNFVDKEMNCWMREEAMENNKLYLVRHKHERKEGGGSEKNHVWGTCDRGSAPRKMMRTTGSQFNPPGDNLLRPTSMDSTTQKEKIFAEARTPYKAPEIKLSHRDQKEEETKVYPSLLKKEVLRNELFVNMGEPLVYYVDTMCTSYIDIDLSKKSSEEDKDSMALRSSYDSDFGATSVLSDKYRTYVDIDFVKINETPTEEEILNVDKKEGVHKEEQYPQRTVEEHIEVAEEKINQEEIPFAEDSDDDEHRNVNKKQNVSKYLQYYLPQVKNGDEKSQEIESDMSTGIESSTESVEDYLDQDLEPERRKSIRASFDEVDNFNDQDEISFKEVDRNKIRFKEAGQNKTSFMETDQNKTRFKEADQNKTSFKEAGQNKTCFKEAGQNKTCFKEADLVVKDSMEMEDESVFLLTCDESADIGDVICQENMVLQLSNDNSSIRLNVDPPGFRKEKVNIPKNEKVETKQKMESEPIQEQYEFLPVSLRRLQFEDPRCLKQTPVKPSSVYDNKPVKVKLITSDNYTDMVEKERLIKEEENKENELDEESSISFSSGSMIVKDNPSDENIEFFIIHNNIEMIAQERSDEDECDHRGGHTLDHVEEESEGEHSAIYVQTSLPKEHLQFSEDVYITGTSEDEVEEDATSASSFTMSTHIDKISLKVLAKTPIEKSSDNFKNFLEERERRMSQVSVPKNEDHSIRSSNTVDRSLQDLNRLLSPDFINHDPKLNEEVLFVASKGGSLTSVSSSSSLSSKEPLVMVPPVKNIITVFEDKKNQYERERTDSCSSTSLSTSSSSAEEDNHKAEYEPLRQEKSSHDEDSCVSSEWSSSSHINNIQKEDPESKLFYEPQSSDKVSLKELQTKSFESSSKKLDLFLKKIEKGSSGTEDTSSSSSDYPPQNKIILKHGDSIEDIEDLLNQQNQSFNSQSLIPLRKQYSLPNRAKYTYRNESFKFKNMSMDIQEQIQASPNERVFIHSSHGSTNSGTSEESKRLPKPDEIKDRISTLKPLSSSSATLSSSSEDLKSSSKNLREKSEYNKENVNLLNEIKSLATSSEEESIHSTNLFIDHQEKVKRDRKGSKIPKQQSKNEVKDNSDSSHTLSSSSYEDDVDSIDILSNKKDTGKKKNELMSKEKYSVIPNHSSGSKSPSSIQKESCDLKIVSTDEREKFQGDKGFDKIRSDSTQVNTLPIHSSGSSCTLSSSSDENFATIKHKPKDSQEVLKTKEETEKIQLQLQSKDQNQPSISSDEGHFKSKYISIGEQDTFQNDKTKKPLMRQLKSKDIRKTASNNSSQSSFTESSSSDEEFTKPKYVATDHHEKFENDKNKKQLTRQAKSVDVKRTTPNHSSQSSFTESSSSDEEPVKRKNLSTDRQEKFQNNNNKKPLLRQSKSMDERKTNTNHSSQSSFSESSSSDEEIKNPKNISIDRQEKFQIDMNKKKLINQSKSVNVKKSTSSLSSKSSLTESCSSDEDPVKLKKVLADHQDHFQNDKTDIQLSKQIISAEVEKNTLIHSINNITETTFADKGNIKHQNVSTDHQETIQNDKIKNQFTRPTKSIDAKITTRHHSSQSSFTESSSSDEESTKPKYVATDHHEKFENDKNKRQLTRQAKSVEVKRTTPNHSSQSSFTESSSSDEEPAKLKNLSIDRQEKFQNNNNKKSLLRQSKTLDERKTNTNHSSQSSFTETSSSDEEPVKHKNVSTDRQEKFQNDNIKKPLLRQTKSMDERKTNANHSSQSSFTDTSSSDEEYLKLKDIKTDRLEKFQNSKNDKEIQKERKSMDQKNGDEKSSPGSSSNLSNTGFSTLRNVSIDRREKFDSLKTCNTIERKKKENDEKEISLEDDTSFSYLSKDDTDNLKKDVTNSQHTSEISMNPSMTKLENKEPFIENRFENSYSVSSSDDEESDWKNRSIDHREKFDNLSINDTIKRLPQGKSKNNQDEIPIIKDDHTNKKESNLGPNTTADHCPHSDDTFSTSSFDEDKNDGKPTLQEVIIPEKNSVKEKLSNQLSESTISSTSEDDILMSDEAEEEKNKRKYQTLPVKKVYNKHPFKEKSKSLQAPVDINDVFINDSKFGGSTVDMVERKYNEYTETWSRQSPIEKKKGIHSSQPNLEKKYVRTIRGQITDEFCNKPINRFLAPLKKGPRPVPSYMSPVNSFPYLGSDHEFESNDSLVDDYSSDDNVEEFKTRHGSLPDFIQDLSTKKRFRAPAVKKPSFPKRPVQPKICPKAIELNYGAKDDVVDSSTGVIRRTSSVSVTTDSSYLDKPVLRENNSKPMLARLDSLSLSMNSTTVNSSVRNVGKGVEDTLVEKCASSTSASSLTSESESEIHQNKTQPSQSKLPAPSTSQSFQEKSKILNGSTAFPVKSNNTIRQKIPSTSESSEYSTTSDEETSSSKNVIKTK